MPFKLNVAPAESPDFEQISATLALAARQNEIPIEDLGYITSTLLSLCVRGLILSSEEKALMDQVAAIILMKSME